MNPVLVGDSGAHLFEHVEHEDPDVERPEGSVKRNDGEDCPIPTDSGGIESTGNRTLRQSPHLQLGAPRWRRRSGVVVHR